MAKSSYSFFQPPADSDVRALLWAIEGSRDKAAASQAKRMLVDLASLTHAPDEVESLLLSHHVGIHLSRVERIAVLVATRIGEVERVAQHLGVNMRVFTSRDEAITWLEDEESMPDWQDTQPR